ncbi:MAG TPA: RNA 2',3'-cyclic phosphodiesterase [Ktedonobacterales bacterium]|jgi:2'-5' RNA ligase
MTRTFIAIELNDAARSYLHQEIQRLARVLPRVRWVDPETLHLTLAFLGDLEDAQLDQAIKAAGEIAQAASPFTVRVGSLGMFGPAQNPHVIWIGLAGNLQPLLDVQARLSGRLAKDGFPPDERGYNPHLTLARIKTPLNSQELLALRRVISSALPARSHPKQTDDQIRPEIPVAHLSVMKSDLTRAGPHYTRLRLCPFAD